MFSTAFWKAAGERAVRTFAQSLVATFGGVTLTTDADVWQAALISAVLATVLSLLTSVAAAKVGSPGPSLGVEEIIPTPDPLDAPDDFNPPEILPVVQDIGERQAISGFLASEGAPDADR